MKKHLSRIFFIIICICLAPVTGLACTTFMLDDSGQPVYGKNTDLKDEPAYVIVNKRGVAKTSALIAQEPDAEPISWTSRFGSVTFNYLAREWPLDGINEAGLFIVLLSNFVLSQNACPEPDSRPPIAPLQVVQYQLDNFSTVGEVIASFQSIRIPSPPEDSEKKSSFHFLVGDSRGNCASIEFIRGEMVCHTGQTMPVKVLANDTYDLSIAFLGLFRGFGGFLPIPHPTNFRFSLPRFVIAADMVQK
jgi:choloylglycine hydrolase